MVKAVKTFFGVPKKAIYPVEYKPGDEIPKELEIAARAQGCLGKAEPAKKDDKAS